MTRREQILKLCEEDLVYLKKITDSREANLPWSHLTIAELAENEFKVGYRLSQNNLKPLIEAMAERIETLEAGLAFYADESNWYALEKRLRHDICVSDVNEIGLERGEKVFAGKRARQALTAPSPLDALLQGEK